MLYHFSISFARQPCVAVAVVAVVQAPADPGQRLHRLSRRPKCTQNINVLS